ncbi:hypothetical protein ICW40_19780, partial [Actinotalea ferrariae]|nr:hypothetical protein [Actinotalea ferrariae]
RRAAQGETEPDDATEAVTAAPAGGPSGTRMLPVDAGVPATAVLAAGGATTVVATGGHEPDGDADGDLGAAYDVGYDDERDADAYDGDAYGDAEDRDADGAAPDGDEGEGDGVVEPAPLPEPRRRVGTVLALGAVLVAVGAVRPVVALLVAVVLAVLVRSVGLDVDAMHARRARRGAGRADTARAVGAWPWYLVRSVLGVAAAALVAASVVVVVGGVGWWLLDTERWVLVERASGEPAGLGDNASWVTPALLAVAVLAGLLTLWFGPMSRATRTGARWVLAAVAPGWPGALTVTVLALAAAVVLGVLAVQGQDVVWWPLPGPPDLG